MFDLFMTPSSQIIEPPKNSGRSNTVVHPIQDRQFDADNTKGRTAPEG
uniref:Uncharacterized protein n=1 Tax=Candidatus Nitrotoga fabula TaxID=2182327 RepID=A0A2X0QU33_9PROT|nr:protein of unknown function [Candidatus Nitrotoga fabula]